MAETLEFNDVYQEVKGSMVRTAWVKKKRNVEKGSEVLYVHEQPRALMTLLLGCPTFRARAVLRVVGSQSWKDLDLFSNSASLVLPLGKTGLAGDRFRVPEP